MNKFTEKVGVWLMQRGNTKQLLAESLGISTVSLNKKLDEETQWTWKEVCRLSDILGCSVGDFR